MQVPEKVSKKEIEKFIEQKFGLTDKIKTAIATAEKSHRGQTRKDGESYLTQHIYPVTWLTITQFGKKITENLIITALLHDAIEDYAEMDLKILKRNFGNSIVQDIQVLSKPKISMTGLDEEERRRKKISKYANQLKKARKEIRIIKSLDKINNLYWVGNFDQKARQRYIRETKEYFLPIAKVDKTLHDELLKLVKMQE